MGKKAGGPANDEGHGITINSLGNVLVTGGFDSTAIFGNQILTKRNINWGNFFLWEVANNPLQSDTSDAVFSIVRPKPLIIINDASAYAGDHKYIPIILEKAPVSDVLSIATNFSARIAYDNSVLSPNSGVIQHGNLFDTVSVTGSLNTSDTIGFLSATALLGVRTISPLNIVEFHWLDGAGNPVDYDADTKSGTFMVLSSCGDSILRNFMITGDMTPSISVNPNPSNGIIHIEIRTTQAGRTQVELLNLLGEKVATISDGELKPGVHDFDYDPRDRSAGSYFMVLTTPSARKMARVDLQK